ncbi:hypothetical protein [Christiangramia sp.]|uniref:hypothetical protein n=1 Tax=Christiangramia sp. TaxID=1931228 RepID=UPI00262FB68B|nr:hypothetical protein [Christiangramia sp.]
MNFKFFFSVISISLFSCSNQNTDEIVSLDLATMEYPQKWELFKMSVGMLTGSEVSGDDMNYQEYYIFNVDNTFSKTRIEDQTETTVKGIYSIEIKENEQGFSLVYDQENGLIGNCSLEPTEYLYIGSDHHTLLNSWWACDGPGLFYKKVEIQ